MLSPHLTLAPQRIAVSGHLERKIVGVNGYIRLAPTNAMQRLDEPPQQRARRRAASPAAASLATSSHARSAPSSRRIALVGSSGGSTLRGAIGSEVEAVKTQLAQLSPQLTVTLDAICFVETACPLDHANDDTTPAKLYTAHSGLAVCTTDATLRLVNMSARQQDASLARTVSAGQIDAIVLISADFGEDGVNAATLRAAVASGTPLLGTGGTSLGQAVEAGAVMLQLSGSVATTSEQRAIASAAALARHWRVAYTPRLPPPEAAILPMLDAILPLILTLSVLHATSDAARSMLPLAAPRLHEYARTCTRLLTHASRIAPPVALGAVAARRVAQLGESGLIAGVLAGALTAAAAEGRSGAAALVAGIAAGHVARRALAATHNAGLPATASTLVCVGGAGLAGGLLGCVLAPLSVLLSQALVHLIAWPATTTTLPLPVRALIGGAMGVLTKWSSINGYYHGVILPLILLEMEGGGMALLGAFDACCLCGVCAGVCAAVSLTARTPAEAAACRRATRINLLLGDYVEACYPYMARSTRVNVAAYTGAALAGAVLIGSRPLTVTRSSAYLPLPIACALSGWPANMALAALLAFAVPAFGTLMTTRGTAEGRRPPRDGMGS